MNKAAAGMGLVGSTGVKRRHVTLLFADLSGSSQLAEQVGDEAYLELLDHFRHIARRVIKHHGGSIARAQGDGVLALFGYPKAHEDVGRRATEAALEMHARISELATGGDPAASALQMHSGIHSGVLVISDGDIERGRFDVTGEVANTAFRLCSAAAPGEILVSHESLGIRQQEAFLVSGPVDMDIRGRTRDLPVLRVLGHWQEWEPYGAVSRRGTIPFIGRQETLQALHEAARAAVSSRTPLLVQVMGEAGIGKTRLLQEFQGALPASEFRVLQGYCEGYLGAEPLQPFRHLIRQAAGRPGGGSAPVNKAGARPPNASKLVAALMELISVTSQRTIVVLLDDWQWADTASRSALEALLAREARMLVVLATRPFHASALESGAVRTLHLQPLSEEETATAVDRALATEAPLLAHAIYRQSGGTPLFIEELCHAATRGQLTESTSEINVAWISALVASRVGLLSPQQAELLYVASVIGNVFPEWLLHGVSDDRDTGSRLQALVDADFLVREGDTGMLRFKHKLTRDAVYAMVTLRRRRQLHLSVAEALESSVGDESAFDSLEALSYHYDAGGASEEAARFAELAGDKALAASALDRARAQYTTALRALDALPELAPPIKQRWCAIAEKLGQACVFDPLDLRDDFRLLVRALELARDIGDPNAVARAEYWLAYLSYARGRPREAVRYGERALRYAVASGDVGLQVQVEATLGQSLASAGMYERALPLLAHAVERKRERSKPGSGIAIGSAYTLARTGYTLADIGRFGESDEVFREALQLLGSRDHVVGASIWEVKCAAHLWQGRWEDAEEAARRGYDIALHCRSRWMVAMGRALGACAGWGAAQDAAALQRLREWTEWIEIRGGAVSTSLNYAWLVEASASLGLEPNARRYAARLFMRSRAGDLHGEAMGCRALARLAAAGRHGEQARFYMARAERAAAQRTSPREQAMNLLGWAEVARHLGQRPEARSRAQEAAAAFERMHMAWHLDQAVGLLQKL